MTIGAPPQFSRVKNAPWRAAVALALVGEDAAASERHWNRGSRCRQPALPGISGARPDPDHRKRRIAGAYIISH
jgi:hypothetical protein